MKPTEYLTITERPNTSITVMSDSRGPLIVASDGPGARAVRYTPDESAKFALAILEAAGVEARPIPSARIGTSEHLSDTAYELSTYIEKQQRAAAEAKEQAELEAEADKGVITQHIAESSLETHRNVGIAVDEAVKAVVQLLIEDPSRRAREAEAAVARVREVATDEPTEYGWSEAMLAVLRALDGEQS